MLKRKSTTGQPMASNAKDLANLARQQKFHSIEARYYSFLFSEQATDPDSLDYTPFQEFCQLMAEEHQAKALVIGAQIETIQQVA